MHVVEELSATVLVHNLPRGVVGIHQMPVPVVEVDAEILPEVGQAMFLIQVGGGVVPRDLQRDLQRTYDVQSIVNEAHGKREKLFTLGTVTFCGNLQFLGKCCDSKSLSIITLQI